MKRLILLCIAVIIMACTSAGVKPVCAEDVPMTCKAPTENEDGLPITNLAGYYNCVSNESGVYDREMTCDDNLSNVPCCTDIGNVLSYTTPLPNDGQTYYISRFSYKTSGKQSTGYTNEITYTTTESAPKAGGGCISF